MCSSHKVGWPRRPVAKMEAALLNSYMVSTLTLRRADGSSAGEDVLIGELTSAPTPMCRLHKGDIVMRWFPAAARVQNLQMQDTQLFRLRTRYMYQLPEYLDCHGGKLPRCTPPGMAAIAATPSSTVD